MARKKVERTPEEWRQYHRDKSQRRYDKKKDEINARRRELYAEQVGKKIEDDS